MRVLLIGAAGCAGAAPLDPGAPPEPWLELAPPGGAFGDLVDGSSLWCGIPPQGGAPYSPIGVRARGPDVLGEGVAIEAIGADPDSGEPLVYVALALAWVQANVGDAAGAWVGPEVHLRYDGQSLDDLAGRELFLVVRATALADPAVVTSFEVTTTLDPSEP
ncbi:MAG: hypothetical protein ABMA64_27100 [Myxococcota bacterium]